MNNENNNIKISKETLLTNIKKVSQTIKVNENDKNYSEATANVNHIINEIKSFLDANKNKQNLSKESILGLSTLLKYLIKLRSN